MVLWTTDVMVNNSSRTMGFGNFSPDMQKAIRHVCRVFPAGFAASDRSYAQPLESQHSVDDAADVASREQPFATYHYCTRESYAVIDTGCQRSAIGRNTLDNIASRLPAELPIKFVNQKFRFSGIGGETVTTRVALIPVCFGQRPGMVRAAVLEDTPNAPFLLSLLILKALNTNLQLSEQSLQFQAINEVGSMFYNEKGQLCLRLFDFEAMSTCPNEASHRWQVRKIIGDECHVFMLQSSIESSTFGNHTEINQDNPESSQCQENHDQGIAKGSYETSHASCLDHDSFQPCAVNPVQFFQSIQSGSTGCSFESAGVSCESQLPRQASNFAETPVTSATPCGSSHGSQHQCPSQQEGLHVSCRDGATVCDHMASHVQQATPARTSSDDSEVCRGIGHSIDELADASTGNGDASGRDGRDRHSPRYDESDDSRQEEAGERSQVEQPLNDEPEQESTGTSQKQVQQHRQFFSGECRDIGHHDVTPESGHGVSRLIKFQAEHDAGQCQAGQVLLRDETSEVHVQEAGSQLPATVLSMSTGAQQPETVPLLSVDSGDQERGVRKAVCYFAQQSEAALHKQEVRQALRRRIVLMRRARGNFPESYPSTSSRQSQGIYVSSTSTSGVPSSMEQTGHQCAHQDENLHTMWTSGDHPAQDGRDHPALGQSQLTQEVRTTSCSEPLTLKAGQRKHVLGEVQKAIDHLEQNTNDGSDGIDVDDVVYNDHAILQEIFHLKLIGEVFSPDRFTQRSSKHGMQPGKAFDLRLGHQFLCPKQRKKCVDHVINNPYDLIVVTPPCTMFSMLQYLGLGKSKESCMNDPEFQRRYHEACVLLNFAVLICRIQSHRGRYFLFEQPWNAVSWNEACVRKLLNAPATHLVRTDQCMFGQKDLANNPIRKRTGFLTNHASVAAALRRTCKGLHKHQPCVGACQGKQRADQAAHYPNALIDAVLRAFARAPSTSGEPRDVEISSIHWNQSCPDGSKKDVKYSHVFHSSQQPTEPQQIALTINPTERQVQFLDEPLVEQFAVDAVANVETSSSSQPVTDEESQSNRTVVTRTT